MSQPDRAEEAILPVARHLDPTHRVRPVGDRHRQVREHLAGACTGSPRQVSISAPLTPVSVANSRSSAAPACDTTPRLSALTLTVRPLPLRFT